MGCREIQQLIFEGLQREQILLCQAGGLPRGGALSVQAEPEAGGEAKAAGFQGAQRRLFPEPPSPVR